MIEPAKYQFKAYHETPEHAALRGDPTPPPDPISVARTQLALAVREHGEVIDLDSIAEMERESIVLLDDEGNWRPALDGESPTGHIVTWTCTGHTRVGTDADDPVLPIERDEENGDWVAIVPEPLASAGGSCRIRHNLHGGVTIFAKRANGEGIGYLFATTLDDDTVHMEFFGGTAFFTVERD